ncbi:MAG: hypothetical protein J1E40_05315, partial [Oscillospiraceae bacterium]|nr:hypothetical protein [Oscillospiraceae bacterium]
DNMINAIGMIDDTLIIEAKRPIKKIKRRWTKSVIAAAILLLCLSAPLPTAVALGSDNAYQALYFISPAAAQTFKPVQRSCTDNGIKMEMISASIDGNKASFYISLHDLEDKGLDSTVDLFDSYSINCPYDSTGYCSFSEYDDTTNTAYFLVNIERMDGKKIKNDKITFSVKELIFGKQNYEGILSDIDLNSVPYEPDTQNSIPYRGASFKYEEPDYRDFRYLIPAELPLTSPVNGVSVTGIGYIDGALHIQTYYKDIGHTDNHGFLYLADENGNRIEFYNEFDISFWDDEHRGSYDEKIIEMTYEDIPNYQLYGSFLASNGYEIGKWEITFKLGK